MIRKRRQSSLWALVFSLAMTAPLARPALAAPAPAAQDPPAAEQTLNSPEQILAFYKGAGDSGKPYLLIHDLFPTDWELFVSGVLDTFRGTDDVSDFVSGFLDKFFEHRRKYLARAPLGELRALSRSKAEFLSGLKSRRLQGCANYATYELLAKADTAHAETGLSLSRMYNANLRAIRQGMDHPVTYLAISDADIDAFVDVFKTQGGAEAQWKAIYTGETEALSPREQCEGWIAFYRTLDRLPDPVAGRWASWFYGPEDADAPEEPDDGTIEGAKKS